MIETLKEVRDALHFAYNDAESDFVRDEKIDPALTKLDALIAAQEKAEPQYLSIERVEGFPEKLEQGPQPLLYSDGINGCMVRRDDVWLALTSQLAMPQSAPSTSKHMEEQPDGTMIELMDALKAENEKLRAALKDAVDFTRKWGYFDVAKAEAALKKQP